MTDERNAEPVAVAQTPPSPPRSRHMKRDEVETMLRHATAAEQRGYLLCNVAPHRLAELCRSYLAVLDAPSSFPISTGTLNYRCAMTEVPFDMIGKRVRLLIEGENNALR